MQTLKTSTVPSPAPELQRAREELRQAQNTLVMARTFPVTGNRDDLKRRAVDRLYAALSWVWDAQERTHLGTWPVIDHGFGIGGRAAGGSYGGCGSGGSSGYTGTVAARGGGSRFADGYPYP